VSGVSFSASSNKPPNSAASISGLIARVKPKIDASPPIF
jgi:hypothetical protein